MPRALWKGAISFGLVHIPVELHPAEKPEQGLDLAMLVGRDLAPVGYKRYNKATGEEVPWEEIVKGYEYEKGQYVVLTDEDFRRANVEASRTVEILAFVDAAEIPPQYFERPYYLASDKRGAKAYALLRETLRKAGKVGIARVVIRTRQHHAALIPQREVLLLNTLRYADELRDANELDLPAAVRGAKVTAREIDLALRLVEDMSEEFKPEKYRDTYREDLMTRIREKVRKGQTQVLTEPEKEPREKRGAEVIDLMALLKKSVQQKGADRPKRTARTRKRAA